MLIKGAESASPVSPSLWNCCTCGSGETWQATLLNIHRIFTIKAKLKVAATWVVGDIFFEAVAPASVPEWDTSACGAADLAVAVTGTTAIWTSAFGAGSFACCVWFGAAGATGSVAASCAG